MKVTTKIYLMKDSKGNKSSVVVQDSSNYAQVCGMQDKDGISLHFESEAYHISTFCHDNDIELKIIDTEDDFDDLWNHDNELKIIDTEDDFNDF